jgi:hypothetical protein
MRRFLIVILLFITPYAINGAAAFTRGVNRYYQDDNGQRNRSKNDIKTTQVPNRFKRIQLVKASFITTKLGLTPPQYDKFWPLYLKYEADLFDAQRQRRLNNSATQPNGVEQLNNEFAIDQKILDIKKHYNAEFMKILPIDKVSLIYKSEKEFNDEALKQLKERKSEADN